jgi:hypothetical protein
MSAAKMIVAALMLPALILAGVIAAVIWILRKRRMPSPQSTRGSSTARTSSVRRSHVHVRLNGG